jgi:DnaK suppressor protein
MNTNDLGYFKTFLLDQKSSILNKNMEFKMEQQTEKEKLLDEAEVASREYTNSMSIHLHERDRSVLYQIERALAKIADGTYGQCESCKELIEVKRLKASPFSPLCIDCMEEKEDPRYLN